MGRADTPRILHLALALVDGCSTTAELELRSEAVRLLLAPPEASLAGDVDRARRRTLWDLVLAIGFHDGERGPYIVAERSRFVGPRAGSR